MAMPRAELLCPVLVGREDERAILFGALDRAQEGAAIALFLAGEAGVGKSRLCNALIEEAQYRGHAPIVGYASAHDSTLPYGPLVTALERAFRHHPPDQPPLAARLRPYLGALSTLLPELAFEMGSEQPDLPHN